jgi:hypothetical protein
MRWAKHVAHTGEMRTENQILSKKPEGKRPIGKQSQIGQ